MRRLLFTIFALVSSFSFANAQSCKVESITLKSRVLADPGSVLYSLGDSIALYPHCIAELLEAAIEGANPDDDTLTQIIKLAVTEYPLESGTIAQAAILAAPDKVDVIRKAFIPTPEKLVATPVFDEIQGISPIENFLNNYPSLEPLVAVPVEPEINLLQGDIEVSTSRSFNPEDVAETALKAIDDLLARLKNSKGCLVGKDHPEIENSLSPNKVETFRLTFTDTRIAITTLDDHAHFDLTDENLETPEDEPLRFQDPVPTTGLAEYLKSEITEKEEFDPVDTIKFTSSLYHIPSTDDLINGDPTGIDPPMIHNSPLSPTLPRGR